MQNQSKKTTICNFVLDDRFNENLTRFWQIEHVERQNTRTPKEHTCETHFIQNYKRNIDGRFIVSLPTKPEELQKLGESRDVAIYRFRSLERKLEKNSQRKKEYIEFMREYLSLQHMKEIKFDSSSWTIHSYYYLPHHCVMKETNTTTKLRVVFDASCKTSSGYSLNDVLLIGSVLQQELISILIRFLH